MNEMSKYFKPSVVALEPYSSARDEYDGQEGIFLDANENSHTFEFNRYPDPYQTRLKAAIGQWRDVDPRSIFIGNGSDEIIDLLIRATCTSGKDRVLSLDPSYGMYKVSTSINEISLDLVELNTDFTINENCLFRKLNDQHKLIFLCSPNNPNGGIINPELIEQILRQCNGLVIIDEAYIDFADSDSWLTRLEEFDNLIVLQTFSKSLGAAGIRLGMAFMNTDLIAFLNKIKPPYNISAPNQKAALSRLGNLGKVQLSIKDIIDQRKEMGESLNRLGMVEKVFPSSANFLLVKTCDAQLVYNQLKDRKIIVRDRSNQMNCEGCLRITIGTKEENEILLKELKEIDKRITLAI